MKRTIGILVLLSTVAVGFTAAETDEHPEKALCAVCAVNGETEMEEVKAHAEHDGSTFYFCSENCKKEFVAEPVWYVPAKLPRPAPMFVVETLDGKDIQSDFAGKVTVIDFWATWCKPCEKVMPVLQRLADKYGDKGFQVMGISIDEREDRAEKIKKYLKKHNITYPVYSDTKNAPAWYTYRVKAVPAMFLVDHNGQVVAEWRGSIDHELLTSEVVRLVEENSAAD